MVSGEPAALARTAADRFGQGLENSIHILLLHVGGVRQAENARA
jgi:hypothetical protein